MNRASLSRTIATAAVGAGLVLVPITLAAPAFANASGQCQPGAAAYPPGLCTPPPQAGVTPPNNGQFGNVPNGNSVAANAVSGSGSSIDTGNPGAGSGPNGGLIAGGVVLVAVALGGGVFIVRRRYTA